MQINKVSNVNFGKLYCSMPAAKVISDSIVYDTERQMLKTMIDDHKRFDYNIYLTRDNKTASGIRADVFYKDDKDPVAVFRYFHSEKEAPLEFLNGVCDEVLNFKSEYQDARNVKRMFD